MRPTVVPVEEACTVRPVADFPASPREPHDRLVRLLRLDGRDRDGWATRGLAHDLAEAAARMGSDDAPRTLAVRRAVLTIGLDLVECCDDSYGHLGDVINEALDAYAGTDWRSAGVPPTVFWPDFLEIFTMLSNYSIMHSREADVFRRAGVAQDLDDVVGAATGLHADYTAARMSWEASLVRELYAPRDHCGRCARPARYAWPVAPIGSAPRCD